MSVKQRWFDRTFALGLGADAAPKLVERLRQTPERLAAAVREVPDAFLTRRQDGKWSIQENAGHLLDLESLWDLRLDDFRDGAVTLRAADLENRRTHEAGHNDRSITELCGVQQRASSHRRKACPAARGRALAHVLAPASAAAHVSRRLVLLRCRARRPSPLHHRRTPVRLRSSLINSARTGRRASAEEADLPRGGTESAHQTALCPPPRCST